MPASSSAKGSLFGRDVVVDPALAALFSGSSGPVKSSAKLPRASKSRRNLDDARSKTRSLQHALDETTTLQQNEPSTAESSSEGFIEPSDIEHVPQNLALNAKARSSTTKSSPPASNGPIESKRKRKRRDENADLEADYLGRLARAEEKEQAQLARERQNKRQKQDEEAIASKDSGLENGVSQDSAVTDEEDEAGNVDDESDDDDMADEIPMHETLAPSKDEAEVEKASRTCFLANVSSEAITSKSSKKTLLAHLSSFFPSLAPATPPPKIQSIRFRSTAYASPAPKKAAFARKELMDATTKSTNAYVVYSSAACAAAAAQHLNGTVVLGRHLRVDSVARPAQIDHRRCVFVGNLGFIDDDSQMNAAADSTAADGTRKPKKKSSKPPADVEEGLWRQFGTVGAVESVRVVRDAKTRVGKGFAYVQFADANAVEAALLCDGKKFPPLLPRALRVVRAKRPGSGPKASPQKRDQKLRRRDAGASSSRGAGPPGPGPGARAAGSESGRGLRGDVAKLLGRAGAAGSERAAKGDARARVPPEAFVFEGHRATSKQGKPRGLKVGKGKKAKAGRPKNRGARRAAAWKAKH